MSHTLDPVATISEARSKSTESPIETEQASDGTKRMPANSDAGGASTPSNGEARQTGRVNPLNKGTHLPTITVIAWPNTGTGATN